MLSAEQCRYRVGLTVALVTMTTDEQFTSVDDAIDYNELTDDVALIVTHGIKPDGSTSWVICWLSVPNHKKKESDSGLITSEAAMRLLELSPLGSVGQKAAGLIKVDYQRRKDAK